MIIYIDGDMISCTPEEYMELKNLQREVVLSDSTSIMINTNNDWTKLLINEKEEKDESI